MTLAASAARRFLLNRPFSILPHALERRLPVVSGGHPHAVAAKHHYGLARSAPLRPSGRLAPRRSQIHRRHNAGLPNQARDPP